MVREGVDLTEHNTARIAELAAEFELEDAQAVAAAESEDDSAQHDTSPPQSDAEDGNLLPGPEALKPQPDAKHETALSPEEPENVTEDAGQNLLPPPDGAGCLEASDCC